MANESGQTISLRAFVSHEILAKAGKKVGSIFSSMIFITNTKQRRAQKLNTEIIASWQLLDLIKDSLLKLAERDSFLLTTCVKEESINHRFAF